MNGFAVRYDRAVGCSEGPTPGARALMAWALNTHEQASNLGIYNCRKIRGGGSWSIHAEGRAIDVGFPVVRPKGHPQGQQLAAHLVEYHAELGVQQVIWAGKIWDNQRRHWRTYRGTSSHHDHAHIELTRAAGQRLTRPLIEATTQPDEGSDDMMFSSIVAAYQVGGRLPSPKEVADWLNEIRTKNHDPDDACVFIAHVVAAEK